MSVALTYSTPNHLEQLANELARASVVTESIQGPTGNPDEDPTVDPDGITITVDDAADFTAVDAVVAAHIPKTRYDLATRLAAQTALREANRLRADYQRLEREGQEVFDLDGVRLWLSHIIAVLERRDRANGLY